MSQTAQGDGAPARLTLPPEARSVPKARRFVRQALQDVPREDWCQAAELAVSEVVTNAVLHAHTPITVQVVVRPTSVLIEVHDENPVLPNAPGYDHEATTGRGLELVEALTDHFGVAPRDDGKVVWFRFGEDPAPTPELDALPKQREQSARRLVEVQLLALPTNLWLAARQQHDALLRELALARAAAAGAGSDLAAVDHARSIVFEALRAAIAQAQDAARLALPANHPAPMPDVPAALDVTISLDHGDASAFEALRDVVDTASRLAEAGELLVRPALPEVTAVRHWVCEQVLTQLAGTPPRPWPGADAPEFEAIRSTRTSDWDLDPIAAADDGRIAVDDTNHILAVSAPLAELVGWRVDQLVGRRIIALVPPRFREAHTAGYTRFLATGEAHALGVDLVLPVLTRDGREIDCTFHIHAVARRGQQMFIATITPVDVAAEASA